MKLYNIDKYIGYWLIAGYVRTASNIQSINQAKIRILPKVITNLT